MTFVLSIIIIHFSKQKTMKKSLKNLEVKAVKSVKSVKGGYNDFRGFGESSSFEIDNNMY
jgi:hypothetical protein